MATGSISSIGLGSTLPVEDIISKLTDLEKAPLKTLQANATEITAKVSAYANIKSLVSTLSDAAAALTRDSGWNGVSIASSNTSAVNATVTGIATASSFNVGVQQLAKVQTIASGYIPTNTDLGGTLTIDVGTWNSGLTAFSVGVGSSPISVTIAPGETSLANVAAKINDANPNLSATVLTDGTGQRLLIRSKATGEAAGFRIAVSNDVGGGLSQLGFDPPNNATGATRTQAAQDAKARINGVEVSSATNTVAGVIPGLSLQLTQVTTTDATLDIATDTAGMKKNIQAFVDAYNAVDAFLSDSTKYDSDTKSAGLLQGDATATGLLNSMRMMLTTSSSTQPFANLGAIGIRLRGIGPALAGDSGTGALQIDSAKLDAALKTPDAVKAVFASVNSADATASGIGVKMKNFATALLSFDGTLNTKNDALDKQTKDNLADQDKVNARAATLETRLRAQYTALDVKMASLTALSNFVTQQVTLWNNAGKS